MDFYVKPFDALSGAEVYEILKARSAVFMMEQEIRYLDIDDIDYRSLHCFMMEEGKVVIMAAGTGSPYFTTDTGSSLRGIEIEADVMLKGTRVDGIYTADPEKDPTATKFHDISYDEVISRGLKVMDITATAMCRENNLPIYVFNMDVVGNLKKVMDGEEIGTFVHP